MRRRWERWLGRCPIVLGLVFGASVASLAPEARAERRKGSATASTQGEAAAVQPTAADTPRARYLQRPVRSGPRFVDHGVLQASVAGGWPHRYRLGLSLGLLDHLTLGVTAHWLPGQPAPKLSPDVAVAFYRGPMFEVGAWHVWSLYPPPVDDIDPGTPSYQQAAQWTLGTASFGQRWVTGGFDAGVVRARVNDPGQRTLEDTSNPSTIQWRFGGGLHLRVGGRRWGFTAQVLVPHLLAEVRLDLRFGLFERRPKGGWRLTEHVEDWDRPRPW